MHHMNMKDRERDAKWAMERFKECEWATLTINEAGDAPYQVPICVIVIGEYLYFHTALNGKTRDLIAADPHVSFSCVTWTKREPMEYTMFFRSAFATGKAVLIEAYQEKYDSMSTFGAKYLANEHIHYMADRIAGGRALVYRFEPDFMIGKEHA
jgi:nitroimidazol reductase NimA-like FMN-containing flavoprotein (pyridoxamine 5'-phosphate oxidase superfamily)